MLVFVSFKENLKTELSYLDMQVKELSVKTGISRHTLDNYLNVRENMPTADVAVKIAKALGVSVEYLVTGEESSQKKSLHGTEIRALIQNFKQLCEDDRKMLIGITQLFKNQKRRRQRTNAVNPSITGDRAQWAAVKDPKKKG